MNPTMEATLHTINLQRLKTQIPILNEYGIGNDFLIGEVNGERIEKNKILLQMFEYPLRFDGYCVLFLRKGCMSMDVDLKTYRMEENSLMVQGPGNIMKLSNNEKDANGSELDLVFILISNEFMAGLHFDFLKFHQEAIHQMNTPCITLTEEETALFNDYNDLARKITSSRMQNKKEIMGALLTSSTYVSIDFWSKRMDEARKHPVSAGSARITQIFERFIGLVSEYHTSERGMAFYADKMCLTPKYLSKLIKQTSGRSAPDWIDSFVILEAKNMLKFSDMAIKEIVYKLHFPNQSVFYKFFKAHTGMTPTEYRNG